MGCFTNDVALCVVVRSGVEHWVRRRQRRERRSPRQERQVARHHSNEADRTVLRGAEAYALGPSTYDIISELRATLSASIRHSFLTVPDYSYRLLVGDADGAA